MRGIHMNETAIKIPESFVKTAAPVPPQLLALCGYEGGRRFVGLHYAASELMYDDGRLSGAGHYWPWAGWKEHPAVWPHLKQNPFGQDGYFFGADDAEATHHMIIDQVDHAETFGAETCGVVYICTPRAAHEFLPQQWTAEPLPEWTELSEAAIDRILEEHRRRVTSPDFMRQVEEHMRKQAEGEAEMLAWLDQQDQSLALKFYDAVGLKDAAALLSQPAQPPARIWPLAVAHFAAHIRMTGDDNAVLGGAEPATGAEEE